MNDGQQNRLEVRDEAAKDRQAVAPRWMWLAVGVGIVTLFNCGSMGLYAYATRTNEYDWLPVFGCCLGIYAAEIYLLAAYLAFSTQPWIPRLLGSWFATLSLFSGWGLGYLQLDPDFTNHQNILHEVGIVAFSTIVLIAASTVGLWMLGRVQGIHWARINVRDQPRTTPLRWSILDLLVLTIIVAVTLALLRWTPIRFSSSDQWAEFGAGLLTAAIFAAINAPVTCIVTMYLLIRCDRRHTAWRPIHFGLLLVSLALAILLGLSNWRDFAIPIVSMVLAVFLAYPTTIVAVLMAAHVAGWQLEWERESRRPAA